MNTTMRQLVVPLGVIFVTFTFLLSIPVAIKAQGVNWQQKAASFVPTHQSDFASESFQGALRQFAATGANHVSLIVPIYQANEYSTTIGRGWNTPTDESLVAAINYAHSLNLSVTLKIHAENQDGRWRAYINPQDRTTWFINYGNWVNHFATIAQNHGVEQFMIGAELYNMTSSKTNPTNTQNWLNLITGVRQRFSGLVTYSAQRTSGWYDEFSEIEFWGALDYLGLSAYYAMAPDTANPDVNDFLQSWQTATDQYIYPIFQKYQLPVLFTEIGYRSINEANKEPWSYDYAGAPNMQLQADLYQALFQFWQNIDWMAGIHIWDWLTNPNAGGPNDQGYTPQNKSAEQTITSWFSGNGTSPTPLPTSTPTPVPTPTPTPTPTPGNQAFTFAFSQSPLRLSVAVAQPLTDAIVDIEVYNPAGQRVYQSFFEHQILSSSPTNFPLNHTFTPGTYRVAAGIFSANWATLYHWESEVSIFTIDSTQPTPTPSPTASPTPSPTPSDGNILSSPWEFSLPSGGSAEKQQPLNPQLLKGKTHLNLTYNLRGECLLSGDASAVIFYQNGSWRFISLAEYGQNCKNGEQTVAIPLANFAGLDLNQNVGPFQIRFWLPEQFSITIYRIWLSSEPLTPPSPTPSPSPSVSPAPSPTPSLPSSEAMLEVWWPTNDANLSGIQPFKAILSGQNLSDYKMYWQVDDGQLVEMSDSTEDYPHKESWVNLSDWNWRSNGPYTIRFVAKNSSGQNIKEKIIKIFVN